MLDFYLKKKIQLFNHPENEELANQLKTMQNELSKVQSEIELNNSTHEYSTYTVKEKIPMEAIINISLSTTAADIIGQN